MITEHIAVPMLDLKAQYATIRDAVRDAIDRVLESGGIPKNDMKLSNLSRKMASSSQ